jgi:hypothetical protein
VIDFLVSYLLIDRIGIAVAVGVIILVFAVAHNAWRRIGPARKSAGE